MDVAPIQRTIAAADIAPERLAGCSQLTEDQKVNEAARLFEALLLRQILAEAQKTVIPSSFTADSTVAGIYRDLVTTQLADSISKAGTFGLAKTLRQQLCPPSPAPSDAVVGPAPAHPLRPSAASLPLHNP